MLIAALVSSAVIASALPQTYSPADITNDVGILQYALILENLENAFYTIGQEKFKVADYKDFPLNAEVIHQNFKQIASHERTHVAALNATITSLGGSPFPACTYNFGITNAKSYVATARVLERVGTSAYNGAISMIKQTPLLTVGASIAEIEARHASFLNTLNQLSPFPAPFETPLSMRAVVTLASPIFNVCPFTIPITGFPALKLDKEIANLGDDLKFANSNATYCAFLNGLTPLYTEVKEGSKCIVPKTVQTGDIFVFLTSDNSTDLALDTSVVAGPTSILVKEVYGGDYKKSDASY